MTKATREGFLPPLWILTLIAIVLCLWLMVQLKELVVLLVVGYALAYLMDPALGALKRWWRIPRSAGFFIVALAFVLVLMLLGATALPTIADQASYLTENFPQYSAAVKAKVEALLGRLPPDNQAAAALKEAIQSPISALQEVSPETIKRLLRALGEGLMSGYSLTLAVLNLALLPFIVFYLAVDFPGFHQSILSLFPLSKREKVRSIAREIDRHVSAFVGAQFIVACILFALYALGLGLLGVKLWFLLAVISGFGNFVPYLGLVVGVVLSSVMALITFGTLWAVIKVWLIYLVIQFLEGSFITPRILGQKVGLSPLAVLIAIFAAGTLFGLLGILLAVPGAAITKVLMNRLHGWVLQRV